MKTGDIVLLRTSCKEAQVEFISAEYNYYEHTLYLKFRELETDKEVSISFTPPNNLLDIEENNQE